MRKVAHLPDHLKPNPKLAGREFISAYYEDLVRGAMKLVMHAVNAGYRG